MVGAECSQVDAHQFMTTSPAPRFTDPKALQSALQQPGHAVVSPAGVCEMLDGVRLQTLLDLAPSWNDLPLDTYLRDGGRYRRRRHSCFIARGQGVQTVPHRAHWQPLNYNALHGGLERWFEPITPQLLDQPVLNKLLVALSQQCSLIKGQQPWFIEAHQFRIDTQGGIGRPTPEGAHRDGVDFVAVMLVNRQGIKGGETRVFEARGNHGLRFTLTEPWTLLMLDDEQVIHESTPIQPLAEAGLRDTLVLTFRAQGFQGP
jgi:hypothetical protein